MRKADLKGISEILPFDGRYVKVEKDKKWNLMDSNGKVISDTWFSSIVKNSDGSIVTKIKKCRSREKQIEVKFISVSTLATSAKVLDLIPVECISFLDAGSIEVCQSRKYIARAKMYGRTVWIGKNGGIYDEDGNELKLLLNTVDCERLYKAVNGFNRKMHYDFRLNVPEGENMDTYDNIISGKIAMWAFFFITEDWHVKTSFTDLIIDSNVKKWTDNLVIRVLNENLPEGVLATLKKAFGSEGSLYKSKIKEWSTTTWNFEKQDLEKIIGVLAKF